MKSNSLGARPVGSTRHKKLPVFVFPEELQFSVNDETSHKQILTIYNPYEFSVSFQVLSNCPKKYAVVESQGSIKAHCCVDIVVRHRAVAESALEAVDKFRIDTYVGNKMVGQKQVLARLVKEPPPSHETKERPGAFLTLNDSGGGPPDSSYAPRGHTPQRQGPGFLVMALGLLCLVVLLLPLQGESPNWPQYSSVTVHQKLIAAFALGLITMALLKA